MRKPVRYVNFMIIVQVRECWINVHAIFKAFVKKCKGIEQMWSFCVFNIETRNAF